MNKKIFLKLLISLMLVAICAGCNKMINTSKQPADIRLIKIGATFPLTGNLALYGQGYKEGVLMAQKEINLSKDYRVQLKLMDNKGDAKLVESDVKYLAGVEQVGAVLNSFEYLSLASKESAESLGLPMLIFTTYRLTDQDKAGYIFRDNWDMGRIGELFARTADNIKSHRLAIIAQSDSSYVYFKENFIRQFKGQILGEEKFLYGTKDFKIHLLKIKSLDIDTIIIYAFAVETSQILKQMSELNMDNYRLVLTEGSEELVTQSNQAVLQKTQAVSYLGSELSQKNKEFIEQYKKIYRRHPRPDAFYAYEGVKLTAEILNRCEMGGIKELKEMRECAKNGLEEYFDENHNKYRELPLVRYDKGWQVIEDDD